jgi:hypothetical protein
VTQQLLPAIRVEATGDDAQRMLACVKACEGFPTSALEGGILRELVESIVAVYETEGETIDCNREQWMLERLGFLGGAAAACCERSAAKRGATP